MLSEEDRPRGGADLVSGADVAEARRRRRPSRGFVVVVLLLGVLAAAMYIPLPYFVIQPGSALAVEDRVTLEGQPDASVRGDLLLTTVSLQQPTAIGFLLAKLDDDSEIVGKKQVLPPDEDTEEYLRAQRQVFEESGQIAAAVALREAGFEVRVSGKGARVAAVLPNTPASELLRVGDVIVGVDGRVVQVASDLIGALSDATPGQSVVLVVQRDGATTDIPVTLRQLDSLGRAGLGVAIETVDQDIDLPFEVTVDGGRIGGPSAGLMIALTVYDLADPVDLAAGRKVAGTGTMELDGTVGPIGGVEQKVRTAEKAGAELFLVPEDEAAAARAAADSIEIIPVRTFDDAVQALREAA